MTNSDPIQVFCQIQHLKYIAHITRLPNSAIQKQALFRKNKKKRASDPWKKYEEMTNMAKEQLLTEMQDKDGFLTLLDELLVTPTLQQCQEEEEDDDDVYDQDQKHYFSNESRIFIFEKFITRDLFDFALSR